MGAHMACTSSCAPCKEISDKHKLCKSAPAVVEVKVDDDPFYDNDDRFEAVRRKVFGSRDDDAVVPIKASPSRPVPFDVVLTRTGAQWRHIGLKVSLTPDESPARLSVDEVITPSLVDQWNSTHVVSQRVYPGDTIVGVNGESSNGDRMLDLMKNSVEGSIVRFTIEPGERLYATGI